MNRYNLSRKEANILAVLVFIIICAMCSCSKSVEKPAPASDTKTVKFYSTRPTVNSDGVTVSISGKVAGGLLYSASAPECGDSKFPTAYLKPGNYRVDYAPYNSNGIPTKTISITVGAGACQAFDLK